MCVVCLEFGKGLLTKKEALQNVRELFISPTKDLKTSYHYVELIKKLEAEPHLVLVEPLDKDRNEV